MQNTEKKNRVKNQMVKLQLSGKNNTVRAHWSCKNQLLHLAMKANYDIQYFTTFMTIIQCLVLRQASKNFSRATQKDSQEVS